MPKVFKGFRFNSNLYLGFKQLAKKNGSTVTEVFEKFMSSAIEFGLVFPSPAKTENVEAEARIMLAWLKEGRYWVSLGGGEETSTRGRLLQLLPNIENADLRLIIEEILKKAGTPLSREQIIQQVLKQRLVKRNTIIVGLSNRKKFQKTPDNKYILTNNPSGLN